MWKGVLIIWCVVSESFWVVYIINDLVIVKKYRRGIEFLKKVGFCIWYFSYFICVILELDWEDNYKKRIRCLI